MVHVACMETVIIKNVVINLEGKDHYEVVHRLNDCIKIYATVLC